LGTQPTSGAGGEQTHTLSTAQLPGHNHGISDPGHSHGVADPGHLHVETFNTGGGGGTGGPGPAAGPPDWQAGDTAGAFTGISIDSAATGVSTTDTGSGSAHNILPPVSVINWFIVHG
ncbi:MAG: hypothetical protein ACRDNS_14195, partial [Trebonia sp.]